MQVLSHRFQFYPSHRRDEPGGPLLTGLEAFNLIHAIFIFRTYHRIFLRKVHSFSGSASEL